jgi:hypothetical protein
MRRVPEMYRCANPGCGRALVTASYAGGPLSATAPERIHRVTEPILPAFSLICTCGHYTVVSPR